MTTENYSIYNPEEIKALFIKKNPAEVEADISKVSPEQLVTIVSHLNENFDPDWRSKIKSIFSGLENREQLLHFGKALNHLQALEVIDVVSEKEAVHYHKFLPILVGLGHKVYEEMVLSATERQIQVLKLEGITEAIQHHLTVLLHDWVKDIDGHSSILRSLLNEINFLDLTKVTKGSLDGLRMMLVSITEYYNKMINKINITLAIAWNTNRPDLIEKFTAIKDGCMKYNSIVIGHPHTLDETSTGLYALLEKKLNSVFSGGEDSGNEIQDILENDDPAIEGLTKLDVWYLEDYWKIGLLPGITDPKILKEDGQSKEKEHYYFLAVANLENIGLKTIQDLEKNDIFSKNMLVDYIHDHQHQLKSTPQFQ